MSMILIPQYRTARSVETPVVAVEGWLWPDESGPVLWGDETEVLTEEV